ncbi:radical SAM protein [Streptomyces sp. NPDC049954]|uniref:radical SAM protein n=1 Tax=Streptomyces sp. NPDC049954 TaxID=3155779 RepID=UPI00342B1463
MHELIAAPYLDHHLLVRPGNPKAARLPAHRYDELHTASGTSAVPAWLADVARQAWKIDLNDRRLDEAVLVRSRSPYAYGRASYELNLGCNYDCEHCYLGLKQFAGLEWPERERLLHAIRDSGVLWLQLTGGEPMIDKLFPETYRLAYELGMMVEILTNGSRLAASKNLALLTRLRPNRITLSLYGATAESYDGLTRRRGAYRMFVKGLDAAHEAGLPLDLALIITRHNAHEADQMRAFAGGTTCRTASTPTCRRPSTAARKPSQPRPRTTSQIANPSTAATPATPSSTSTRTAWRLSARSAVTKRSPS